MPENLRNILRHFGSLADALPENQGAITGCNAAMAPLPCQGRYGSGKYVRPVPHLGWARRAFISVRVLKRIMLM